MTPNYNLRMETAPSVIAKVNAVRAAIRTTLERSSTEPLSRVLSDPVCAPTHVVKVLDVHPCLGKVAGRRLMAGSGVPESATVGDLDDARRAALASACRCGHG